MLSVYEKLAVQAVHNACIDYIDNGCNWCPCRDACAALPLPYDTSEEFMRGYLRWQREKDWDEDVNEYFEEVIDGDD